MSQSHKVCTSCGYIGKAGFNIVKLASVKCPKCECLTMVSLRSAEGRTVLDQGTGQPRMWSDSQEILRN